jgi:transposase
VLEGHPAAEVARFLDVHERTVREWVRRYRAQGSHALQAKPHPGPRPKLSPEQQAQVLSWFRRSPTEPEFGFANELWTASRVSQRIRHCFGLSLSPGHLLRWLARQGIRPLRVRRRPRGHDPEAKAQWREQLWPPIASRVQAQGGRSITIDETGMLMCPLVRRSLAPRGHPLVMRYQSKHRQKVSVQAAVVLDRDGRVEALRCQMHEDSYVDGLKTAQFLRRLLAEFDGPLKVIWDRGNMHKGPHVRAVLQEHPRLTLEQFPPYCPDLNPVEGLWSWVKYGRLANFCPRDLRHLSSAVASSLAEAMEKHSMLQNFTRHAGLNTPQPARALAA